MSKKTIQTLLDAPIATIRCKECGNSQAKVFVLQNEKGKVRCTICAKTFTTRAKNVQNLYNQSSSCDTHIVPSSGENIAAKNSKHDKKKITVVRRKSSKKILSDNKSKIVTTPFGNPEVAVTTGPRDVTQTASDDSEVCWKKHTKHCTQKKSKAVAKPKAVFNGPVNVGGDFNLGNANSNIECPCGKFEPKSASGKSTKSTSCNSTSKRTHVVVPQLVLDIEATNVGNVLPNTFGEYNSTSLCWIVVQKSHSQAMLISQSTIDTIKYQKAISICASLGNAENIECRLLTMAEYYSLRTNYAISNCFSLGESWWLKDTYEYDSLQAYTVFDSTSCTNASKDNDKGFRPILIVRRMSK